MNALGDSRPNKLFEDLVLATVPVIKGKYSLNGTGDGSNIGTGVEFFLRLTSTCADLKDMQEVRIPYGYLVTGPDAPLKVFRQDFDVRFAGPGRR